MKTPKKMTSIISIIISSMLLCVFLIFPAAVLAKEAMVLKFSHQWVKGDIRDTWARNFISLVENRTKGSLKFELYPGAVLFKPHAQFDAIRRGALDLCVWPLGYTTGKYPLMAIADLPVLNSSLEKAMRFAKSEAGKKLEEISENAGIKIVGWGWLPVSVGCKKRPIKVPSDLKGLKMRGAIKSGEILFSSAGAAITKMPSTEVYMALQTGTLDGCCTTTSSFLSFRLFEVLDYLTIGKRYNLWSACFCIVMRPATFKKLTASQQSIIMEAGEESASGFLKDVNKVTERCEKAFKEKGVKVDEMSSEDYAAWIEEAKKSSWKWFREKVKGGGEMLDLALKVK